jgi:aspartyl-tRNA(Asn)/glutamyl-tRNA(Gln) amidotransferase subunit C
MALSWKSMETQCNAGYGMTKVSKEELLKIAAMSALKVTEEEIPALLRQLDSVVTYAARVTDFCHRQQAQQIEQVNVFREDVVITTDSEPILQQAPDHEQHYFVVPKILDN